MPDLKISEAAQRLGLSRQRTNTLANEGALEIVKNSRPRQVTETSVVDYQQSRLGSQALGKVEAEVVERSGDPLPSHHAIREMEHLRDAAIARNDPDTLNVLTLSLYRETRRAQINDRYLLRSEAQEAFETALVEIRRFLFTRDQMDNLIREAAPDLPLSARNAIMEGFIARFSQDVTPVIRSQGRRITNENTDDTSS